MADTKTDKRPPTTRRQCGTVSGYQGHYRHGERPCEPCRVANREYQKDRREKKASGELPERKTKTKKRAEAEALGDAVLAADEKADPAGTTPDRPEYPKYLKSAGRRLWADVTAGYDLNPAALQVLAHACRMTDQVERFAAALASRQTFWFEVDGLDEADEKGVPVVVNGMIGEGRQLSNAIRTALGQIGVLNTQAGGAGTSIQDQIKAKREERLKKAQEQNAGGAA